MRPLISEGGRQPARYLISGGASAQANNTMHVAGARAAHGILENTVM